MEGTGEIQKRILIYIDTIHEPVSVNKLASDLCLEQKASLVNLSLARFLRAGLIVIEPRNGENVIYKRTSELAAGNKETLLVLS